jgi:N-acetylglucosaminyldiphosphoundecaprenol N-acetyl-beta-D-mannosaminyltransferase
MARPLLEAAVDEPVNSLVPDLGFPVLDRHPVVGSLVNEVTSQQALQRIQYWASAHESRYVCACNVHMAITARGDGGFRDAILRADLVLPDGAPIAWMLRRQGVVDQPRVSGPDLMLDYMALAAQTGESVFLVGGTPKMLAALQRRLLAWWPGLRIAGAVSPPFRPQTAEEDEALVAQINASGASTVWVGLGCPKQEQWMSAHRGRVHAVMVGVGAAFAFHSGFKQRAPRWMQDHGMEWLHRLINEPGRLWRRYLSTNLRFLVAAVVQLVARLGRQVVLGGDQVMNAP